MRIAYAHFCEPFGPAPYPTDDLYANYDNSLGLLYPDEPCWHMYTDRVEGFLEENPRDLVIFEGPRVEEFSNQQLYDAVMATRASGAHALVMDGENTRGWTVCTIESYEWIHRAFQAASAVGCRHPMHAGLLKQLTRKPVFQWDHYMSSATLYEDRCPTYERTLIAIPNPPLVQRNHWAQRGCLANVAVLRAIHDQFPDYEYTSLQWDDASRRICELYDLPVHQLKRDRSTNPTPTQPETKAEVLDALARTKLFVNMDHAGVTGCWTVDACATGTPTLCTSMTACGHHLRSPVTHPHDVDTAIEHALGLLRHDRLWQKAHIHARTVSGRYTATVARTKLEKIVATLDTLGN